MEYIYSHIINDTNINMKLLITTNNVVHYEIDLVFSLIKKSTYFFQSDFVLYRYGASPALNKLVISIGYATKPY